MIAWILASAFGAPATASMEMASFRKLFRDEPREVSAREEEAYEREAAARWAQAQSAAERIRAEPSATAAALWLTLQREPGEAADAATSAFAGRLRRESPALAPLVRGLEQVAGEAPCEPWSRLMGWSRFKGYERLLGLSARRCPEAVDELARTHSAESTGELERLAREEEPALRMKALLLLSSRRPLVQEELAFLIERSDLGAARSSGLAGALAKAWPDPAVHAWAKRWLKATAVEAADREALFAELAGRGHPDELVELLTIALRDARLFRGPDFWLAPWRPACPGRSLDELVACRTRLLRIVAVVAKHGNSAAVRDARADIEDINRLIDGLLPKPLKPMLRTSDLLEHAIRLQ